MVKKLLLGGILFLFLISYVSAFCTTQGYIIDKDSDSVNASKINIICQRTGGDILFTQPYGTTYGFPFGDWYDDCTYCDKGVFVNAFNNNSNLYGEFLNLTCSTDVKTCHTNIYMNQISEDLSSKVDYDAEPSVGGGSSERPPMPKSNESPQTKVSGIKPAPVDFTYLYILGGIIAIILSIILINSFKHGK